MKYAFKTHRLNSNFFSFKTPLTLLFAFGMIAVLFAGCSSSTSVNEEEDGKSENETKTFALMLSSDSSTQVGTATTEIITEESDAYIDEGFFITLDISMSGFEAPFDISMRGGQCGTWGVQDGDQAEMPCDYDNYLSDPADLTVTSEDGSGVEAYPVEQ